MVTTSSTGKEYTHDIAIISIEGTLLDIRTASNKLVKIMNKLSEELHDLYLYGAPKFVNKGEETSKDGIPPVSDFLLGEDCLSIFLKGSFLDVTPRMSSWIMSIATLFSKLFLATCMSE